MGPGAATSPELSRSQRARRLRPLARAALAAYGVEADARMSLLAMHSFNVMFEARTAAFGRVVLRVGDLHRIHADGVEEIEAEWIDALAIDVGIVGPRFIRALDGRASVDVSGESSVSGDGVLGVRRC